MAAVGEIIDVSEHRVVHRQRQLGSGGRHLFPDLVLQLGVHREGHLQNVFERCLFELSLVHDGRGAQFRQVVAVDAVHHLVQLPLILLPVDQALIAGFQHQIDGAVEFAPRVGAVAGLVGALARLEAPLRGLDGGVALRAALEDLRVREDDCGDVGAQINVVLNGRRFRQFHGCRRAVRRRREERHLESGLLCVSTTGGNYGYGEQQKRAKSLGSNFHSTASVMKIKYFREPVARY